MIDTQALRTIVERLEQLVKHSSRTADAAMQSAESLVSIEAILQRIASNQISSHELQELFQQILNQGFAKQFVLLQELATALNKWRYDVGFSIEGQAEISGDQGRESASINPGLIRQLQREMSLLRQAIVEHSPTTEELALLEQRYRQHLIHSFESLTFQGMMRTARAISLPLEDVYVELRAVAEVPEAADAFSVEERRLLLEVDEKDDQSRHELLHQMDALRRERWSRTLPERKSIAQTLHSNERRAFVILGDPGSGKSTLLRLLLKNDALYL